MKHMRSAHSVAERDSVPSVFVVGKSLRKPAQETTSQKPKDLDAVDARFTDTSAKLDAKHQWGGSFRDNGKFGSYPSHDDMGDESTS